MVMAGQWQTLSEMESIMTTAQQVPPFVHLFLSLHILRSYNTSNNTRNNFDRTRMTQRKKWKKSIESRNCSLAGSLYCAPATLWSWFVIPSQWSNSSGHLNVLRLCPTCTQFIRLYRTCDRARKKSISTLRQIEIYENINYVSLSAS